MKEDADATVPWALGAAWAATFLCLTASCTDQWTLVFGFIYIYLPASLASLRLLLVNFRLSLAAKSSSILNATTASLCVWLVAVALLNTQIVAPSYAPTIKALALPMSFVFALFLKCSSSSLSDHPVAMSCAVAICLLWICTALWRPNRTLVEETPAASATSTAQSETQPRA